MKKLIISLVIITGCGYAPIDGYNKQIVITKVEQGYGSCYYYGRGNESAVKTPSSANFKFIDTCGKFQIGDTIRFSK